MTEFTFVTDLELTEHEVADGLIEQFGLEPYSVTKKPVDADAAREFDDD